MDYNTDSCVSALNRLNRAIRRLVRAEVSLSWAGAGLPGTSERCEKEVASAKKSLNNAIDIAIFGDHQKKLFDVFARYSDLSNNVDRYFIGTFEAANIDQVKSVYPEGVFCGFEVREKEAMIRRLPKDVQIVPKESAFK